MAGEKNDDAMPEDQPPRQTYMPKPPSKEEVEQVSREQAMVTDDWTGEPPSASEGGKTASDEAGPRTNTLPRGKGGGD
jgi:hypothetical protein